MVGNGSGDDEIICYATGAVKKQKTMMRNIERMTLTEGEEGAALI
jgi:hypothetical protein